MTETQIVQVDGDLFQPGACARSIQAEQLADEFGSVLQPSARAVPLWRSSHLAIHMHHLANAEFQN
jgi:hypothetical protein